jgi:RNA polymerase sigma factor (sigma-70 family)
MDATDGVLLERWAGRRDAEAFQALVKRHSGMVFSACRRILRDPARAEDVTQECFLKLAMGDGRPGPVLGPWLHRVATRRCLDTLRSERRRSAREARYAAEAPKSAELRWETLEPLIDVALAELPERMRVPIAMHYLEGLSHDEIAQRLSVPRTTVSYRISQGLERMGKRLRSRGVSVGAGALAARLADMPVESLPHGLTAKLSKMALAHTARPLPKVHWLKTALTSYAAGIAVAMLIAVAAIGGTAYVRASQAHGAASGDAASSAQMIRKTAQTPRPSGTRASSGHSIRTVAAPTQNAPAVVPAAALKSSEAPSTGENLEPGALEGTVVDNNQQPIAEVEIRVLPFSAMLHFQPACKVFDTRTDAQGRFALTDLPARERLAIVAAAEGYDSPTVPGFELAPGQTLRDQRIVLARGVNLHGKVLRRNGNPAPGAFVIPKFVGEGDLWNSGGIQMALTDAKGEFRLGYRAECKTVLRVMTPQDGEAIFGVEVQADTPVELRMPAGAAARGCVTGADGKPVEGMNVYFESLANETGDHVANYHAVTDATGRYELSSLPPDVNYLATVEDKSDNALTNELTVGMLASGTTTTFDIRLEKPGIVRGTVTGELTGRPQRDARIGWVSEHGSNEDATEVKPDGSYELQLFEPGTYTVYAMPLHGRFVKECREKYGRSVNVGVGSEQKIDFHLPDAYSLGIRLVDGQGKPIAGAEVVGGLEIEEHYSTGWGCGDTDAEGRCRYDGFPPGYTGWLSALVPPKDPIATRNFSGNGANMAETSFIKGEPGVEYPEETVVLYGPSAISGVAVGPDGQPLSNCRIGLEFETAGVLVDGVRVGARSGGTSLEGNDTDASGAFIVRDGIPATALSGRLMAIGSDNRVYAAEIGSVDCKPGQVMNLGKVTLQLDSNATREYEEYHSSQKQ